MKFKKGDQIEVLRGRDKGKKGKIERVLLKREKVIVSGINLFKKHVKPQGEGKPGGRIEITKPLSVSAVSLVCPKCNKRTRIGRQIDKEGRKLRICRKCEALI